MLVIKRLFDWRWNYAQRLIIGITIVLILCVGEFIWSTRLVLIALVAIVSPVIIFETELIPWMHAAVYVKDSFEHSNASFAAEISSIHVMNLPFFNQFGRKHGIFQ